MPHYLQGFGIYIHPKNGWLFGISEPPKKQPPMKSPVFSSTKASKLGVRTPTYLPESSWSHTAASGRVWKIKTGEGFFSHQELGEVLRNDSVGWNWKMVMKLPSTRLPWFWREVSWQYHGWQCSKISFNEIKRKGMSMYGIHLHLTMLECLMLAPSYPKIGRACGIPQGVLSIVCIDRIRHGHKLHLHTKRLCQWNTCPCKRNHPSVVGWVAAAIRGLVVERRFYAIVGEIRKVGAGTYKISYLDLYLVIVWSI